MSEDAPNRLYAVARQAFGKAEMDWVNDVMWVRLLGAGYVPDTINHRTMADIPGSLLDVGPLDPKDVDYEGYCLAGPLSVANVVTTAAVTQMVIYRKDALVPANEIPVLLITQMGGLPVQLAGDFFRLDWGSPEAAPFNRRVFRL